MRSFRDFFKTYRLAKLTAGEVTSNTVKKGSGVIPEPIHFKHVVNKVKGTIKGVIPSPIHFKHVDSNGRDNKTKLDEAVDIKPSGFINQYEWAEKNDNEHLISHLPEHIKNGRKNFNPAVSEALGVLHKLKYSNEDDIEGTSQEAKSLYAYTGTEISRPLNKSLIDAHVAGKSLADHLADVREKIDRGYDHINKIRKDRDDDMIAHHEKISRIAKNNVLKTSMHVYSGVGFDPQEHIDENNFLHSPAHISTTHDKGVAMNFANKRRYSGAAGYDDPVHVIHIYMKPGERAINMHSISSFPEEHEFLLPAGTTLKHHGITTIPEGNIDHRGDKSNAAPVHIHHMSIHHQE